MGRNQTVSGRLFLVGVGPGDPQLLTLKAARIIGAAPVVAYLTTGAGAMALSIAQAEVRADAIHLPIAMPMVSAREPGQAAYDAAAAAIGAHLDAGRDVAYLCEGDPLLYGSAMYLLGRLAGRQVSVVPGVTSMTAAAAAVRRPLAARSEMLKILPASLPDETLRAELAATQAAVLIKVGRHLPRVRAVLLETGHAAGAVVVEHASGPGQKVHALADRDEAVLPYFSTILCYRGDEAWQS